MGSKNAICYFFMMSQFHLIGVMKLKLRNTSQATGRSFLFLKLVAKCFVSQIDTEFPKPENSI